MISKLRFGVEISDERRMVESEVEGVALTTEA